MNEYRACEAALKTALESTGVPVEREKNGTPSGDFITYAPLQSIDRLSADDSAIIAQHTYIINAFSRTNVTALIRLIRTAIISAGGENFTARAEVYEDDTKLFRTPITIDFFETLDAPDDE